MAHGSDEPGGREGGPGVGPRGRSGQSESQQTESTSEPKRVPGAMRLERLARSSSSARGKAYQGALEAVFSIVIATLVGYWADQRFGTSPRYLIVGAVVGFCSFVLRLVRMRGLIEPVPEPPADDRHGQDGQTSQEPTSDAKSRQHS